MVVELAHRQNHSVLCHFEQRLCVIGSVVAAAVQLIMNFLNRQNGINVSETYFTLFFYIQPSITLNINSRLISSGFNC